MVSLLTIQSPSKCFRSLMIACFTLMLVSKIYISIVFLQGSLPSDADGEVSRTACVVGFSDPCLRTINIKIKNCVEYMVYYLLPSPQTSTAYCIGNIFFFLSPLSFYLSKAHGY